MNQISFVRKNLPKRPLFPPPFRPFSAPTSPPPTSHSSLPYPILCAAILRLFISESELSDGELNAVVQQAAQAFDEPATVISTKPLDLPHGLHICELWHGPTLAFKDLGLQVLGGLLNHFLSRRRQRLTILVGTSGDTGARSA